MTLAIRLRKIVSGGQTGADRAALDWAIARGLDHGGWCPRGRRAEDGVIDARYRLTETSNARYLERTGRNVRDSDATLILSVGKTLTGGSQRTMELARRLGKPCLHVSQDASGPEAGPLVRDFVRAHSIGVLNVAGPRASSEPGIAAFVADTLERALGDAVTARRGAAGAVRSRPPSRR